MEIYYSRSMPRVGLAFACWAGLVACAAFSNCAFPQSIGSTTAGPHWSPPQIDGQRCEECPACTRELQRRTIATGSGTASGSSRKESAPAEHAEAELSLSLNARLSHALGRQLSFESNRRFHLSSPRLNRWLSARKREVQEPRDRTDQGELSDTVRVRHRFRSNRVEPQR